MDKRLEEYFPTILSKELLHLFTGRQIGFGCFRDVYECAIDPERLVIKFEFKDISFSNVIEWDTWQALRYSDYSKWFAPCKFISPCGRILIQERTEKVSTKELPRFLPVFFTDTKKDNFGMLDGRIVCHDYGFNRLIEEGLAKKVRKVNWYG